MPTINQLIRKPRKAKVRKSQTPALRGSPQRKGIATKVYVVNPCKPNSAARKVLRATLSTGEQVSIYIPGEGHSFQVNSSVLVRGGGVADLPGSRYTVVRGAYDCQGVQGRKSSRSLYGTKKPK